MTVSNFLDFTIRSIIYYTWMLMVQVFVHSILGRTKENKQSMPPLEWERNRLIR